MRRSHRNAPPVFKLSACAGFIIASVAAATLASSAAAGPKKPALPNLVAAGDVTGSTAVLWARTSLPGKVTFEFGTDPTFETIAGAEIAVAVNPLIPAKVEVDGLTPNTTYFYRVTSGAAVETAEFRTSAPEGVSRGLRFGVSGDWRGELSPYPAVKNADERGLEFFIRLGDTIYADYASPAVPEEQCLTLDEFRLKHDEVYSERFGLHAWGDLAKVTSVLSTIDDHEVTNDFEGGEDPERGWVINPAQVQLETPSVLDTKEGNNGDSDDPAIWVHPTEPSKSLVICTKKNAGLSVYDLAGNEVQSILPGKVRYNNVDIIENFTLAGLSVDLAVATDRLNDLIVVWKVNPETRLLEDVTDPKMDRVFPDRDIKEQETAYGLAGYTSEIDGVQYIFVSRRSNAEVAQLKLADNGGVVGWELERTILLPAEFEGWSPEDPQVEGMVADDALGVAYLGQEQVGIWRIDAEPTSLAAPMLIDQVKSFKGSVGPGNVLEADVEGLTIYPLTETTGYLIVSSQGDNTFAVYEREGDNEYLHGFALGGDGAIDAVQESDGADVVAVSLGPLFPNGLFVTQDGNNLPAVLVEDEGEFENANSNFKFVDWSRIAATFKSEPAYVNETILYGNGLQAFQEYNPIHDDYYGETGDPRTANKRKLYRYRTYGSDAAVLMLDARSFRDPELPPVTDLTDFFQILAFITASFDPSRTMLSDAQKADLKADLLDAHERGIVWKFIIVPEPIQNLGVVGASDRFEGYAAERTEILKFIDDNNIGNVVFIAADIHGTLVNNLTYQLGVGQPQIPLQSFEVTTGSVAFDAPFGPTIIELAAALGLLSPEKISFYESLPMAGQDAFLQKLLDGVITTLGYDAIGLEGSPVKAELLQGGYTAVHVFGWTEFEIDPLSKELLITTWGIEPYNEEALLADPEAIVGRDPEVISKFAVVPVGGLLCDGDLDDNGVVNGFDLAQVLAAWGTCGECAADLSGDGIVDQTDVALLLGGWGDCP